MPRRGERREARRLEAAARLLEAEARRTRVSERRPPADGALVAAGWTRRSVADAARAEELAAAYAALGFEVRAEPLAPDDLPTACAACRLAGGAGLRTLYTRRPARDGPTGARSP